MEQMLPVAAFTTADLLPQARYEAWRNLIRAVFEPSPPAGRHPQDLHATVRSIHLGPMMVAQAAAAAQYFTRSRHLIEAEGLDHFLIQVYSRGACEGTYGQRHNATRPGDIKIIDMARTFHSLNTDFDNITLTVPRTLLAPLLARPDDLHGMILPRAAPAARILASHIRGLMAHTTSLGMSQGAMLAAATSRLVAACLGPNTRARDEIQPSQMTATRQAVRDFIDHHLASPLLDPDTLARRFNMSRAHLYRLFEEEQGVVAYIRARRLRRCLQALTDATQAGRAIGEIALSFGFNSEAHFSRVFRRAFGATPSEARAGALRLVMSSGERQHTFISDWMRALQQSADLPATLAAKAPAARLEADGQSVQRPEY